VLSFKSSQRWLLGLAAGVCAFSMALAQPRSDDRMITVVAVIASDKNKHVDPRVKCIADEVQKLEPNLTGFRLATTTNKSVRVGNRETFPLVDDEVLGVLLQHVGGGGGGKKEKDKEDDRVRLTVKAPLAGEITYSTCCSKFFPIMTRYLTKDTGERLIVAIMVRPAQK
jgi:hypothetical protein